MTIFETTLKFCQILLLLGVPTSKVPAQQVKDWLIVPKVRVGPITASSTEKTLRENFGDSYVSTFRADGEVQSLERGTIIYRNDDSRVVAVSWRNQRNLSDPDTVTVFCFAYHDTNTPWRTTSGISSTTTLREVEAINGRPFTLSGSKRELRGTVISWRGGKLEQEVGGGIKIGLWPDDQDLKKLTQEERKSLDPDEISSDTAVLQKLNPMVDRLVFTFPKEARPSTVLKLKRR
jgi:hypothetical protein